MGSERNIIQKLNEAYKDDRTKTYTIKCIDEEGKLVEILEAIKVLGNIGHSCNVVIDPGTDNEVKVFYDGDGSDRISEIIVE